MLSRLKLLRDHGVRCEHVPLAEGERGRAEWLTPTGALGKGGWLLRISIDKEVGGMSVLKALQNYTNKLTEKYGKRAFSYFSKVDMHVLGNEKT